jgi:hypothetical protein
MATPTPQEIEAYRAQLRAFHEGRGPRPVPCGVVNFGRPQGRPDSAGANGSVEPVPADALTPGPKKHRKPELYDLVAALHGQGFHARLIARILGIGHTYASRVLHDLELERPRQKLTVEQALMALPAELRLCVDNFRRWRAVPLEAVAEQSESVDTRAP